jgi:hypothetical protein
MVHANLAPEYFTLDNLTSKDVSLRDLCLVKKDFWDLLHHSRKVQNTAISDGGSSCDLGGF